jgi:hypothetical protein
MRKLKQIIKNLNNAETLEEVDKSSKEASQYYQTSFNQMEKDLLKRMMLDGFEKSKENVKQLDKGYNEIFKDMALIHESLIC